MVVIINNVERKSSNSGKGYLMVSTSNGKMSCWKGELFDVLEKAQGFELEIMTETTNKNGKEYTNLVGVKGAGGAVSHTENSSSPNTPPAPTYGDKAEAIKQREVDVTMAITNATTIAAASGTSLSNEQVFEIVQLLAPKFITLKKQLRKDYE